MDFEAELKHEEGIFGYLARLKYSKTAVSEVKTVFFSRPIVFRIDKPGRHAPFDVLKIEIRNELL